MSSSFKPEGHSTVSPYLIVNGASATIDFLVKTLGAVELVRLAGGSGIKHAEVRIDDTVVMLSDGEGMRPIPSHVHVYVPDVDATYERALAAGGTAVQEPTERDDPSRRGGVRGPGGTTWWFSTQVE
jgi:PhnB protein